MVWISGMREVGQALFLTKIQMLCNSHPLECQGKITRHRNSALSVSILWTPTFVSTPLWSHPPKPKKELCQGGGGLWGVSGPPAKKATAPHNVLLPGRSHGQRSLVGCSPCGCKELDSTERLHLPFSLSCIGEGNGNPLQYSCLENPRDGGAWWAAV